MLLHCSSSSGWVYADVRSGCRCIWLMHIVVVQSLNQLQLFRTPWTAACQVPLSSAVSQIVLKLMSIEPVMLSNYFILCRPLLLLHSIFLGIQVFFQWVGLVWRTGSLEKTLILERLMAGGEGDDKEWDGWMASLTQWTWVWISSANWWWTGKPRVLQSMGSRRVRYD